MTEGLELNRAMDEAQEMRRAVQAALAHAEAAGETADFVRALDDPADPARVAEYANLLAREESAREARTEALHALGLSVPSMDSGLG